MTANDSISLVDMPDEILFNILTSLDIDDLKKLQLVNKHLHELIIGEKKLWTQLNLESLTREQYEDYENAPMAVVRDVFRMAVAMATTSNAALGALKNFLFQGHYGLVLYTHALLVQRHTTADMNWAYSEAIRELAHEYREEVKRPSARLPKLEAQELTRASLRWAVTHFNFLLPGLSLAVPWFYVIYKEALHVFLRQPNLEFAELLLHAVPMPELLGMDIPIGDITRYRPNIKKLDMHPFMLIGRIYSVEALTLFLKHVASEFDDAMNERVYVEVRSMLEGPEAHSKTLDLKQYMLTLLKDARLRISQPDIEQLRALTQDIDMLAALDEVEARV